MRRSPAVSQGYLARTVAVEGTFERTLLALAMAGSPFQVLSCGAGFDTSYFRLRNMGVLKDTCSYFEVDYPQVVAEKARALLRNRDLMRVCLGDEGDRYLKDREGNVRVGQYSLLASDLTKVDELETRLRRFGMNFGDRPTLVLCECSMTYVDAALSTRLYRWLASTFSKSHLVIYEQILPGDRFGRIMKSHFKSRATPLLNVDDFPKPADQERRFRSVGFEVTRAVNLCDIMEMRYGPDERSRRRQLEPDFDEFEEFFLKCSHYSVAEATKGFDFPMARLCSSTAIKDSRSRQYYNQTVLRQCSDIFSRYGHQCLVHHDNVFVFGGVSLRGGRSSVATKFCLSDLNKPMDSIKLISRTLVFSAACLVTDSDGNKSALCFGGRASPSEPSAVLLKINLETWKQEEVECRGSIPRARWRHTMTAVGQLAVVVGGRDGDEVFGDVAALDVQGRSWSSDFGDIANGLHSHAACADDSNGTLIVTGGLDRDERVVRDVVVIDCVSRRHRRLCVPGLLPRFSHSACVRGASMYLVGGVSSFQPGVAVVNLENWTVRELLLDVPRSVGLYNHALVRHGEYLYVFGGGGNCFSFGMHMATQVLQIRLLDEFFIAKNSLLDHWKNTMYSI